ncbi:PREDICTED: muscular LMNA-interacting protein isoform X3 [Cyprinodon variegatus]|uniref:muscular LMNA-interacting protein isoform X3 n=1 Tax=Cyprinodon variegatus TaxID=28743 RepID=UPI0007426E37|nr:PREDICTED: muscular LMNA-interacting protein isoform X3 [Cyprinodon variegatus]
MPAKPAVFTFVPLVHKLPVESILAKDERSETLKGKSDKSIAVSQERTTGEAMSQEDICKAEIVFIKDVYEEGVRKLVQLEQEPQYSPPDHESFCGSKSSPSVSARSENTPKHEATATVSMETVVDKCRGSSWQQCYDISGHSEHSLGYMANTVSVSEDRTSPINSPDLFPTPSSSRESILSEGLDKERSWYSMQPSSVASPTSFSRTVSQCSSIRSGVFSPSVVQIRRHVLAPGSSLIHTPQSCFSSCDSLSSSTCQQSPPSRRRPPLTRLSLLTAILRKGRLPVLSSGLQRPYTPCWPVNPVTLSVCNACSAASSVASVPLEISSRFSMPTSVDSRNRVNWEPSMFHPSPLAAESSKPLMEGPQIQVTSSQLRREQVISPPLNKSNTIPETFPPLLPSLKSISMVRHEKPATRACTNSFISKLQKLSPTMLLTDHTNNSKKVIPPTSTSIKERENSVPLKWTCPPNSSLSRLQRLSQQLRSQPGFPSPLRPAPEQNTPLETGSSLLDLQQTTKSGGDKSEGSRPVSTLQTFQKGHNLSPSCYKTVAFPGWSSPTNSATPTPSPAPPSRDFTSSPSWSQCSTPSPRPGSGISDCSGREDKKRKQQAHKIKSSYKSLAAIPTNTILLDQQAIDEEVEEKCNYSNTQDRSDIDTHEEMCSPAELRQKSEELYAVIDEILANTGPPTSKSSTTKKHFEHNPAFSKSLGRETKYASLCSLHPSANKERKLTDIEKTKPGVIRPMTAIPRLTDEVEDWFKSISLRKYFKQAITQREKMENIRLEAARTDLFTDSKRKLVEDKTTAESRSLFPVCELHIKEPDEQLSPNGKEVGTSFGTTGRNMEVFEACL